MAHEQTPPLDPSDPESGNVPTLRLLHDEPLGPLWTVAGTTGDTEGDVDEPVDFDTLELDADLRVRLRAWSSAVSSFVWEVGVHRTHTGDDETQLDLEEHHLAVELERRSQPTGWRVRPVATPDLAGIPVGRQVAAPEGDALARHGVDGTDLGSRSLRGGNAAARRWATPTPSAVVERLVRRGEDREPDHRDERGALWFHQDRTKPTELTDASEFVTRWVFVAPVERAGERGVPDGTKTIVELGVVVLPAPREGSPAPDPQPPSDSAALPRRRTWRRVLDAFRSARWW